MRKSPLSNSAEKSTLFQLQVWPEYSAQIRLLACSVTFLCNYNEFPLGIEVSPCTDYSNEMECAMGCCWSLRYFLARNNLLKCIQNISTCSVDFWRAPCARYPPHVRPIKGSRKMQIIDIMRDRLHLVYKIWYRILHKKVLLSKSKD